MPACVARLQQRSGGVAVGIDQSRRKRSRSTSSPPPPAPEPKRSKVDAVTPFRLVVDVNDAPFGRASLPPMIKLSDQQLETIVSLQSKCSTCNNPITAQDADTMFMCQYESFIDDESKIPKSHRCSRLYHEACLTKDMPGVEADRKSRTIAACPVCVGCFLCKREWLLTAPVMGFPDLCSNSAGSFLTCRDCLIFVHVVCAKAVLRTNRAGAVLCSLGCGSVLC